MAGIMAVDIIMRVDKIMTYIITARMLYLRKLMDVYND
jgi:hypothetical protein